MCTIIHLSEQRMPKLSTVYNPCIIQSQSFLFSLSGQNLSRISNLSERREGKCWMMLQAVAFHASQNPGFTSLVFEREMKTTAFFGCRKDSHLHTSCTLATWLLDVHLLLESYLDSRENIHRDGEWQMILVMKDVLVKSRAQGSRYTLKFSGSSSSPALVFAWR